MKVQDLRAYAKASGIKGYSRMNKRDLEEAIEKQVGGGWWFDFIKACFSRDDSISSDDTDEVCLPQKEGVTAENVSDMVNNVLQSVGESYPKLFVVYANRVIENLKNIKSELGVSLQEIDLFTYNGSNKVVGILGSLQAFHQALKNQGKKESDIFDMSLEDLDNLIKLYTSLIDNFEKFKHSEQANAILKPIFDALNDVYSESELAILLQQAGGSLNDRMALYDKKKPIVSRIANLFD